jgi:hypothetical protein
VNRALPTLAALALATTAHADDDKPEMRHMLIAEVGNDLTLTTEHDSGVGKLFDAPAFDSLNSGLKAEVVIRIQITPADSDVPVAEQLVQRNSVYDLWNEHYDIETDGPDGHRKFTVKTPATAYTALTEIDHLPIAKLAVLPINKVFIVKIVAELNPVSKENLGSVQRSLRQGTGGGIERGGGFFGSFVSVFYNPKLAKADRVLSIRSQPFYRPPP